MSDEPKRLLDPDAPTLAPLRALLRAALPPLPTVADEETIEAAVDATIAGVGEVDPRAPRRRRRNDQRS